MLRSTVVLVGCLSVAMGVYLFAGPSATHPTTRPTTRPTTQVATRPAGTLPPAEAARVRALMARLGHPDPDVRQAALDALRDVGREAAPYLVEGLTHPSAQVRAGCARALGLVGAAEALQPLLQVLLADEAAAVRSQAAHALGAAGQVAALSALCKALADTDAGVRAEAALSIGQAVRIARARRQLRADEQAQIPAAVGPLIDALRDPLPSVRGNAAMSLGVLRDPTALAPLALAALDKDATVRASVCHGLADLADPAAGGTLVALLDDGDVTVRRSAIEALTRITGYTLGYDPRAPEGERRTAVARWRAWWDRTKRRLQVRRSPASSDAGQR